MRNTLLSLAASLALSGCALLGKSDPLVHRYFTPEYDGGAPAASAHPELQLRLGRIEGWSHLRERMAGRSSAQELFFYEDRRWTERPEIYLRRALARTLFEERGLVEVLSGRAVTLEVELIAFEELEPQREARMQVRLMLRDDRLALLDETITLQRPVGASGDADEARAVVDALSQVLRAGVTQMADRVVAKLAEQGARAAKD
jgi:cholesterol transport system auxiliary component